MPIYDADLQRRGIPAGARRLKGPERPDGLVNMVGAYLEMARKLAG
jgi:hypothetical protein